MPSVILENWSVMAEYQHVESVVCQACIERIRINRLLSNLVNPVSPCQ